MIKIHYVKDISGGRIEYTEENRWATIKNGDVITKNEENGLGHKSISEYLNETAERMIEPLYDPIGLLGELDSGTVRAVVPSRSNPDEVYRAGDWDAVINDGTLTEKERNEVEKYRVIDDEKVIPNIVKERGYKKQYEKMIIYLRGDDDMEKLAVMDLNEKEVIDASPDFDQTEVSNHALYVARKAPLFDPINLLNLNTRHRVIAIVDPDTGEEITTKDELI